jgi:hypothetical protein
MILVMSIAAVMVTMLVATALPAFADGQSGTAPNCSKGQLNAAQDALYEGDFEGFLKHLFKASDQCGG